MHGGDFDQRVRLNHIGRVPESTRVARPSMFEHANRGRYDPSGFTDWVDMAK